MSIHSGCITVAALALGYGCVQGAADSTPQSQGPSATQRQTLVVHWITVNAFEDMYSKADAIVHGVVAAQRFGRLGPPRAGDKALPLTFSKILVKDVLFRTTNALARDGAALGRGSEIEVEELGGPNTNNDLVEPDDKPLLQSGDEGVFFLYRDSASALYYEVGGFQGRFYVRQGKIQPLAAEFERHDGRRFDEFAAEVANRAARLQQTPR